MLSTKGPEIYWREAEEGQNKPAGLLPDTR